MIQRIVITYLLLQSYLVLPRYGFVYGGSLIEHLSYSLCHANIYHLLGNIVCLWMVRTPLHIVATYAIAVLCSFLPCLTTEPTMGFSGVLFAIIGVSWGKVRRFGNMIIKVSPFILVTAFIPHVNALIHIYCLLSGYLYGMTGIADPLNDIDKLPLWPKEDKWARKK